MDDVPTLADIQERCDGVFCWCNRCSHNAELPIGAIIAQLGPSLPFPEIHGRLRCQACGSKDVAARPAWVGLGQVTRHTPDP